MVVDTTSSRNFRVGKSPNSFRILEVYIGFEAEEFFSIDNTLLEFYLTSPGVDCVFIILIWVFLFFSSWSLVDHSRVPDNNYIIRV